MAPRPPRKAKQIPISMGGIVRERLPLPYVHYPRHYGTFFAFSAEEDAEPALCECSRAPIVNYLRLRRKLNNYSGPWLKDRVSDRDRLHFPESLLGRVRSLEQLPDELLFMKAICHRCNMVPPTMRYCHEMYGVVFIQHFGWYVDQAWFRFGMIPRGITYLDDVTPDDFVRDIEAIIPARSGRDDAMKWFREGEDYTRKQIAKSALPAPKFEEAEIAYHQHDLRRADGMLRRAERCLSRKIENTVREEFGFRKVGEMWTSETLLYTILRNIYPDLDIIRHHRPDWLGGLEVDIYIPGLPLAIEYQGQQHFHAIRAWGGPEALSQVQERDRRKAQICVEHGLRLIVFDYTEPLVREHVEKRIAATPTTGRTRGRAVGKYA